MQIGLEIILANNTKTYYFAFQAQEDMEEVYK
jgi:hypothetical protein